MKKNFFQFAVGIAILSSALVSCEKDPVCVKCIKFNDKDFGPATLCVGDYDIPSEASLNEVITGLEEEKITYTSSQKCQ